jgi:predicted RNA-binding Zn ribbon-like protein
MAKRTKSDTAKLALRRLAEDEEVQAQLRTAAIRLREAWGRAARRPGSKAVEDKKLYDKVREAATSLTLASGRLWRQPEPPKRNGRKAVVVIVTTAAAVYAINKRRSSSEESAPASGSDTASAEAELRDRETTTGMTG